MIVTEAEYSVTWRLSEIPITWQDPEVGGLG